MQFELTQRLSRSGLALSSKQQEETTTMQPDTLKKYQTRAQNFYREHCGSDAPDSAQICAALLTLAPSYRPNAFSTLKNALMNDQLARGNTQAAKAIRNLVNPVTAQGSQIAKKPKLKQIRKVTIEDFKTLYKHLHIGGYLDEAAALVLANYLGVRPCEMRTITVVGHLVHIIGGKKSAELHRGADRTLLINKPNILKLVEWAAHRMSGCPRTNTAIRDRFRKECRSLWPRRKKHPTLKSFRHQMGSILKASGESPESLAYIMGHQSTSSISVYGDGRLGDGMTCHIRSAEGADLTSIRQPKKPPRYGQGRILGEIVFPAATRGHWYIEMRRRQEAKNLLTPKP
ncbi:site-specific integrase [Pseudomonas wenzhouensis]|nr:site-specific integrase [Pseudomonas wenzhouensis]MDM9653870.1 site-specific integrase [Pseudomonas wenzhouensis]